MSSFWLKKLISKQNLAILCLAIVVGLFTGLPQLILIDNMRDQYQGVYPIFGSDDLYYGARAQESLDGHIKLANPYLLEHKESRSSPFWFPDLIVATVADHFTEEDVGMAFIILDFIVPALLVTLTYFLLISIYPNWKLALTFSALLHLGVFLDEFGRSPSPQINFLFFLSLLMFTILAVKSRKLIWYILIGFNLGGLFYIYPYYWTYFFLAISLWALISLVVFKNWRDFWLWVLSGVIAGVLGLPYLSSLFGQQDSIYHETLTRLGMIDSHFPSGLAIGLVVLVACGVWFAIHRRYRMDFDYIGGFLLTLTISSFLATNHHVVTGKNLEFSSHYFMPTVFVSSLLIYFSLSVIHYRFEKDYAKLSEGLLVIVVLGLLLYSGQIIWQHSIPRQNDFDRQRYSVVLDWLRANTKPEEVVWANNSLSALVPIYTKNNVFYVDSINFQFVGDEEVVDRFLLSRLDGEVIDDQYLKDHERYIWRVHYINQFAHISRQNKFRKIIGFDLQEIERLPGIEIKKVLDRFSVLNRLSWTESTRDFQVDYLIIDRSQDEVPNKVRPFLIEKTDVGSFDIYKINRQ